MAITFPTTLDAFTNPTNTTAVKDTHPDLHSDNNDAIGALEAKVGVDSSAVTTSHDYKLSGVAGSDKAVSLTGSETLTGKTLTSPKVGTAILDTNGNELVKVTATGSAINEITLANAATGNDPIMSATGGNDNVGIKLNPKGTGKIQLGTANLQVPNADGTINQVLKTDGSGVLSFIDQAVAVSCLTLLPYPLASLMGNADYPASEPFNVNTTLKLGMVILPFAITINKISFYVATVTVAGTLKIGVYSENGQTQEITHTTVSIDTTGKKTETLAAPVSLTAGVHYFAILPVSTTNVSIYNWNTLSSVDIGLLTITDEPTIEGTLAVTASTLPATFTPSDITGAYTKTPMLRLDN